MNSDPPHTILGKNLIFLISQPRAGSTLLQVLLSGSPDVSTTGEPWIALHPLFALRDSGMHASYNSDIARKALLEFLHESCVDEDFYKAQLGIFLKSLYSKAIENQGKIYFLDKTPRYYHIISELLEIFPDAKFLILLRNPLAVLHSILKTWVKDDFAEIINYMEDLWIAPSKLLQFAHAHTGSCISIKYEDLVLNPEEVLEKICRFIGIQYTASMLEYERRLKPSWNFGDKTGLYKNTLPSRASLEKWRSGFETPEASVLAISYLESLGSELVHDLGYDFAEIKNSLQLPACFKTEKTPSFKDMLDIAEAVSSPRDLRRAAFIAFIEGLKQKSQNNAENFDYNNLIRTLVVHAIRPKIQKFETEINRLKEDRNSLRADRNRLQREIGRMRDTLSWKITAPLRNSQILNNIFKLVRK